MATDGTKHLFVLSFPNETLAKVAVGELNDLKVDKFVDAQDYAVVTKGADGKLKVDESKSADPGAQRGALAGGLGAGLIALAAGPIGIGAVVVGAGIGAVAGALKDSGFKSKDLDEVGRLMEEGRSVLLVAIKPEEAAKFQGAIDDIPAFKESDRRLDFAVDPKSKNILHDAIGQYHAEQAKTASATAGGEAGEAS